MVGFSAFVPVAEDVAVRQMYLPGTAILITRFLSPEGVGEVIDFMPVAGTTPTTRHRLVRLIRVIRGTVRFEAEIRPRFDYGREVPTLEIHDGAATFKGRTMSLGLSVAPEQASPGTWRCIPSKAASSCGRPCTPARSAG